MDRQVRPPVWQILAAVAVGLWVVGLAAVYPLIVYVADLFVTLTEGRLASGPVLAAVAWVLAAFMVVPAVMLGWLPRSPQLCSTGRAWMWAGGAFAALNAARLVPLDRHELYLSVLAAAGVVTAVLIGRGRRTTVPPATPPGARLAALAGGLLMLLPWAWVGALGGLTETVAAAVAAGAIGWLAARLLTRVPMAQGSWAARVLLGGLISAVVLTPIAAATGGSGVSLAELVVLPPLGFAAAALRSGGGLLVGVAAAGPLAFVDPEETSALLGTSDVGFWALIAAAGALAVALGLDIGYAATIGRRIPIRRPLAAVLVLVAAAAVCAVHIGLGQPGLHGERLFVVVKGQADLGGVAAIADRTERVRETYRRLVDTADRTQAPLRKDLRRWGVNFRPYYLVNGLEVDGGPAVRAWLSRRSDVDRVLLNPVLRPLPRPPNPLRGTTPAPDAPLWNIEAVGAPKVWSEFGVHGGGIVIGTADSGVDGTHPALARGFRGGDDSWYDPWNGTSAPTDRNGHGTHTLGSAVGADGIGVAPDATWIGCVNLDRNLGNPARYLDCLQFLLAPFPRGADPLRDGRSERAAHVLTNSWGCPRLEGCDRRVLRPAVAALATAGLFFAAAAGNTGPRCGSITDEPAIAPEAFTVGAVDEERRLAEFSSRGPVPGAAEPDVVAPGVGVRSALPGGGYGALDGTSMAAPHVAGVVALMWSANPKLIGDIGRTEEILRSTAVPAVPTYASRTETCGGPHNVIGAGLVDAHAAVRAARAAD